MVVYYINESEILHIMFVQRNHTKHKNHKLSRHFTILLYAKQVGFEHVWLAIIPVKINGQVSSYIIIMYVNMQKMPCTLTCIHYSVH